MTYSELIERVDAQIVALALEQGVPSPHGYLTMNMETMNLLKNRVWGMQGVGLEHDGQTFAAWKGFPIYVRKSMAFGDVEAIGTVGAVAREDHVWWGPSSS